MLMDENSAVPEDAENEDYGEKISRFHREQPVEFFAEILKNIWMDQTEEDAWREWTRLCKQARWYAADALVNLAYILANPPGNLPQLVQQYAWVELGPGEDYMEWVRQMESKFKQIYVETA